MNNEEMEVEVTSKKETLLKKGKSFLKAGLGKAKDAVEWVKDNPLEAGAGAVEVAAGVGIILLTAAGLKSTADADRRSEDLYQAAKEKLEKEPEKEIYILKQ